MIRNPWVGYIDRTYEQIKANVLTRFQSNVPEITDHTESNPWVKGISIWAGIAEMLGYYIDRKARESFLPTCTKFSSAVKHARKFDYRVRGAMASTVDLRFTISAAHTADINIPIGTQVRTRDGIPFITLQAATIPAGATEVNVPARQWAKVSAVSLGTSSGAINQRFILEGNVVDNSINIVAGFSNYQPQETFAFSNYLDTHFVAGINEDSKMQLQFGDNINGVVPNSGDAITAEYFITEGRAGNVGPNTINQLVSTVTVPVGITLKVNNFFPATGGADHESLSDLKKRIPLSVRTKWRAVTKQDYIDIAELAPGVAKAGLAYECGKDVEVYIAPEGGGVATSQLMNDTLAFINERKMITTNVKVEPAGEVIVVLVIDVYAFPNFSNAEVNANGTNNLVNFLSIANQKIQGRVELGDIYQVLEGTTGVDYSRVRLMVTMPYARPLLSTASVLDWTREVLPKSTETIKWGIRFLATNQYELSRAGNFMGSFSSGQLVEFDEIRFTVQGSYSIDDSFEFFTYPYNQSITLAEPSIPVTYAQYVTLNVQNGI